MKVKNAIWTAGLILASGSALAQEDMGFNDSSVSLGFVGTTGNTDTQTFNLEFKTAYKTEHWLHTLKFQGLGSQEDSSTTAERYYLENKSDYALKEDQYLFAKGNYTDDRFSGFNYQAAASVGYGRYFFRQDNFSLEGFGGAGYRQNDVIDAGSNGEAIISLGENLTWKLTEWASLTQSLTSEIGETLTITRFEVGLVSNIIDRISTKIAFQARNTSQVPAGNKKTDTQTSISLVYTF
ncbi:MAG: DUF481 domain-containing protein [Pseudomonadales bacterium]|nr:DUF481 domain-containing protein [Pseudomonadales bacterium]